MECPPAVTERRASLASILPMSAPLESWPALWEPLEDLPVDSRSTLPANFERLTMEVSEAGTLGFEWAAARVRLAAPEEDSKFWRGEYLHLETENRPRLSIEDDGAAKK